MTKISNQYSLTNILTADLANSRLGINNVSPTVALDVTGAGKFSSSVTNAGLIFNTNDAVFSTAGSITKHSVVGLVSKGVTGTVFDFSVYSASGTALITNPTGTNNIGFSGGQVTFTGGNVGIGTSSLSSLLHVKTTGDGYNMLTIESTGGDAGIALKGGTGGTSVGGWTIQSQNGGSMVFVDRNAGNTERMRITSGGNVGIGTASPAEKLSVLGTISVMTTSNAPTNSFVRLGTFSNGSWGSYVSAGTNYNGELATTLKLGTTDSGGNGTDRMTISTNGSIGAPSGTNIYNASDARLKKNISKIAYGLDTISALNPVKFNWVDGFEPSEDGKDMLGFVAQEVQTIIPEAIEGFGGNSITIGDTIIDNPLRVNEKFIIPVLVKAIQELSAKVSLLENK